MDDNSFAFALGGQGTTEHRREFPVRGDLLEEVTHLQGWTYWISGNAPAYLPEYHFFGGYALPAQGS